MTQSLHKKNEEVIIDRGIREPMHVSVRLPWHDLGWNGHICDDPKRNPYCGGQHSVSAERIRNALYIENDLKIENTYKGNHCNELKEYIPPCSEYINVFGNESIGHKDIPPEFLARKDVEIRYATMPPFSSGAWPFESMWDEKNKPLPANVRKNSAKNFFDSLIERKSLIFYYCNYDNPITAEEQRYLLVGISRLKKKHNFVYWPKISEDIAEKYGDFVWSRVLENCYPEEGIRIPYQEYIASGKNPEGIKEISVIIDEDLARRFKYVSRHITNDDATILIEQAIRALKKVKEDGIILGDWDRQIEWLDIVLRECWTKRGSYPGLASVLYYCGFKNPGVYVREELKKINPENPRDYVFDRLEGKVEVNNGEAEIYSSPKRRFDGFNSIGKKLLRGIFPLFDLTEEQVERIMADYREHYGITSSLETICENPYCICEEYAGSDIEDRIGFHRIDNGLVPHPELGKKVERIDLDDPRRLRAMMVKHLEMAAKQGHTFLDLKDLFSAIQQQHKESGRTGRFLLDNATWSQHRPFFTQKLILDQVQGLDAIFLQRLHTGERIIRNEISELVREEILPPSSLNWHSIIEESFKKGVASEEELIVDAVADQIKALELLIRTRFGILTGGAGTGKTTVLKALVNGIRKLQEGHRFLLLAPTGKASVIMHRRIGLKAKTIHSFLREYDWINLKNFSLKQNGGRKCGGVQTVIIDEASMLDVDLLATLFRAINWHEVERLILTGDVNQLPPIGPGKPFADILAYIRGDGERKKMHLAELTFNCRQVQGSQVVRLASHYARSDKKPDEEVLWIVDQAKSEGDLHVYKWEDEEDLYQLIGNVLEEAVQDAAARNGLHIPDYFKYLDEAYDYVHGIKNFDDPKDLEAVQIISPYRRKTSGVDNLNLFIQRLIRGPETVRRSNKGYVDRDKVIQIRNIPYWAYDHESKNSVNNDYTYVPNGTIGYVLKKWSKGGKVQVKFPPNFRSYSFYLGSRECDEKIELGYALSVHKAQGSQFTNTILILPSEASDFISRELLYTALTRAEGTLYLLIERDAQLLKDRTWAGHSEILRRNSALFRTAKGIPKGFFEKYKPENLIEEALPDLFVRSFGEAEVSRALAREGIPFYYEKPLFSKDRQTYRFPDFTFTYKRKTFYWEHLGMLDDPQYSKDWERKRQWYIKNGYESQLITTPIEGMSLNQSIEHVLKENLSIMKEI